MELKSKSSESPKEVGMHTQKTHESKEGNQLAIWGVAQLPPLPVHQQPGKLQLQTRGFGHAHKSHKEK